MVLSALVLLRGLFLVNVVLALDRSRPNFVLFLQDDQDEYLGGWTPMKQATTMLVENGARATNGFIHTPVCCPSRSELLTGRYFHNVRMPSPSGGCMHADTEKVNPHSFAKHLGELNYTAAWFGKHLNAYPHHPPPGFDCPTCYWFANGGGDDFEPGGFLNATFSDFDGGVAANGSAYHRSPGVYQADTNGEHAGYTTSIIANKSIEWLKKVATGPQPFFLAVASKGPHIPATPAPWHTGAFSDKAAPRTPDYNASAEQLAGHHWLIAQQDPITEEQGHQIDDLFRNRWRTLLSIDDAIAGVVDTLESVGAMSSTYFVITSDHGFNLGQHRLPSCKLNVYDHDLRIPMVIKGPGIKGGTTFDNPVSNVDIAPTILGLAGVDTSKIAPAMDGRSMASLLIDAADSDVMLATRQHLKRESEDWQAVAWRKHHLVEYHSNGNLVRYGHLVDDVHSNTYRALRFTKDGPVGSGNMLYAEFTSLEDWNFSSYSFVEIFDLDKDPHQLNNLANTTSQSTKASLHDLLKAQWQCAGRTCEELTSAPEILAM